MVGHWVSLATCLRIGMTSPLTILSVISQLWGKDRHGQDENDLWLGGQCAELRDHRFSVGGELRLVFPVLGFGIVRAELDGDDVGLEGEGVLVAEFLPDRLVAFFEHGSAGDAEITHDVLIAEKQLKLAGIGENMAVADARPGGDRVTHARDADDLDGRGFSGQRSDDDLRHFPRTACIGVDLVGEEIFLVDEWRVEVDGGALGVLGDLLEDRNHFAFDDFVGDAPVAGECRHGQNEIDFRFGRECAKLGDHRLDVGSELGLVLPVVGLGVVRAELDRHDVGLEGEGVFVGLFFPDWVVALFEHRPRGDAKVAHDDGAAEHGLNLAGVALRTPIFPDARASGDRVAHAGDADDLGGDGFGGGCGLGGAATAVGQRD